MQTYVLFERYLWLAVVSTTKLDIHLATWRQARLIKLWIWLLCRTTIHFSSHCLVCELYCLPSFVLVCLQCFLTLSLGIWPVNNFASAILKAFWGYF